MSLLRTLFSPRFAMGLRLALAVAMGGAAVASCGDPLVTAQDRGDAVFGVSGKVRSAGLPPTEELTAAVIFVRVGLKPGQDFEAQLETEVIPGTIEGTFPADFRVDIDQKPRAYPYNVNVHYINLDQTLNYGVFDAAHSPNRVRIGHLAIGPASELAALPETISFSTKDDSTIGKPLAPYLPNTTITPYQVLYAEGVEKGDLLYPERTTMSGPVGGTQIQAGFTLVDARTFLEATEWQQCARAIAVPAEQRPEHRTCVTNNAQRVGCVDACFQTSRDDLPACHAACAAMYPGQLDRYGCTRQVAGAEIDAACGPEKVPLPEQLQILDEDASLSVTLGEDDIKAGMWILHATLFD
jgi:hypothetical protein